MNLAKLGKKAKQGDKEALVQLVMHEKNTYYRLAYMYVNNEGFRQAILHSSEAL